MCSLSRQVVCHGRQVLYCFGDTLDLTLLHCSTTTAVLAAFLPPLVAALPSQKCTGGIFHKLSASCILIDQFLSYLVNVKVEMFTWNLCITSGLLRCVAYNNCLYCGFSCSKLNSCYHYVVFQWRPYNVIPIYSSILPAPPIPMMHHRLNVVLATWVYRVRFLGMAKWQSLISLQVSGKSRLLLLMLPMEMYIILACVLWFILICPTMIFCGEREGQ